MRKLLLIVGGIAAGVVLIVAGVVGYAYLNLNSIIAANRAVLLEKASAAVGRPLEVGQIKATLGWGVAIELTGVRLADDANFSQLPFVEAGDVMLKAEVLPLLHKEIQITELVLERPQIRIIRAASGAMNFSSMTRKGEAAPAPSPAAPGGGAPGIGEALPPKSGGGIASAKVTIATFTVTDGRVFYLDKAAGGAPITINAVNLKVTHFSLVEPFNLVLSLAALGDRKNLEVSGTAGPIVKDGAVEAGAIPLALEASIGPFTRAQLRAMPQLAKALPAALTFSGEATLQGKVAGTLDALNFDIASNLGPNQIALAPTFQKPAGTNLKLTGSGSYAGGKVAVRQANLELASLRAKLTDIAIAAKHITARIDTNNFDLAPVAQLLAAARPYSPTGTAEIHAGLSLVNSKPALDGTITLANLNTTIPGSSTPPLSNLSGTIKFAGNTASAGPLTFKLGSGNATLRATADSIQPVHAAYQLSVDKITLAELVPSRKDAGDENLVQVAAAGTVGNSGGAMAATTKLSAASGMIANVPFTLLALDAGYGGDRVNIGTLKFGAFDGSIGASGAAAVGAAPTFDLKVNAQNIDLQQALASQHAKAAETIRGHLTADLEVAGKGKGYEEVKPSLRGSGRARIDNGKLIGVNVAAQALKKVDNVPGIGALVPAAVVANHPQLFKSPDTDIDQASLTFVLAGPRLTSHDLVAKAADYSLFGDGWFDFDKNIELAARIVMSKAFSSELVAAKHNVVYLTDRDQQVEIPLRVAGQLPHPAVMPDVGVLARRAASHAAQQQVGQLLEKKGVGKLLEKGGLGGLLGGLTGGAAGASPTPTGTATPGSGGSLPNPFKGLFH